MTIDTPDFSYRDRNEKHCIEQLFPPYFDVDEVATLANEVLHLLSLLAPQHKAVFPEHDLIFNEATQRAKPTSLQLKNVLTRLRKDQQLGFEYLPAFVACTLELNSYSQQKFEQYKALTLVVAVRLLIMGEHNSAIIKVCNELRQFSNGKREKLAAWLPDPISCRFQSLIEELERLRETAELEHSTQVAQQLAVFHVPYRDSYERRDGITRQVSAREFNQYGHLQPNPIAIIDDENDATVVELIEVKIKPDEKEPWRFEEATTGKTRAQHQVTFAQHQPQRYAADAIKAKTIIERLQKKKMSLPCDTYLATDFEIRALLKACMTSINGRDSKQETAQLILLMLILGNQAAQVRTMQPKRDQHKVVGIKRQHKLPSQVIRSELQPLVSEVSTQFTLPLPQCLAGKLTRLSFDKVDEADIKTFLSELNKNHTVNITQSKISTFLTSKLKQEGIDPVLIELIKGSTPNELAALSYTQVDLSTLLATFERYVNFLVKLGECPTLAITPYETGSKAIGSPLAISDVVLKRLLAAIKDSFSQLRSLKEGVYAAQYHNRVTVYTTVILALASGYRPVTGWLGKMTDINVTSRQYWISDKENRLGDASRVIVLPAIALDCLKQYQAYLSKAALHFCNKQPALHLRYQDAIFGHEHLFFFRNENNSDPIWQEVSPKTMMPVFDSIFPLQPNWHRHHIRTLLAKNNIHSDLIAAWMGHAEVGEAPFAQYSSLKVSHLEQIANVLQQHFESIDVKALAYV